MRVSQLKFDKIFSKELKLKKEEQKTKSFPFYHLRFFYIESVIF